MTGLSFSVVCSVVLVIQTCLFSPVLPSDLTIELSDGEPVDNFIYDIAPSLSHISRLKRQVTIPITDIPDKTELNKGSSPTKKPIVISNEKVVPTVQQQENISTNSNINPSLPTQNSNTQPDNNGNHVDASDANNGDDVGQPFADEDLLFEGNSSYPHQPINNTYYQQNQNLTISKLGNFKYYTVHHDNDGVNKYWIDMKTHQKAKMHEMLSNAHRRAATVKPNFPILFYGHEVQNLTVATGGFIYLGDQVHAWLAATQYVAPLMANFDSSTSLNATLNYINEDDYFAVEWNQVRLQDSPNVGPFTFQTTLFKNGTIVFVYKTIPIPVGQINDTHHPVKVGLSDAYIKDKNMLFVRQKTIYEYDRVDLKHTVKANITNGTAIIFTALPTCHQLKTCEECTTKNISFVCAWCPATNRCSSSNATDRYYQDWTHKGCDKPNGNYTDVLQCSRKDAASTYNVSYDQGHDHDHDHDFHGSGEKTADSYVKKIKAPEAEGMSAAGVIGVMFLLMLVFGGVGWLAYAYFFPHSPSGQMLIRYRPSTWAFRRGEARYTAASIHM